MKKLKGHDRNVNAVAFSPDGKVLASGAGDNKLILWDVATGDVIKKTEGAYK